MKSLYTFSGTIKKSGIVAETIHCIADSEKDANTHCSGFASNLVFIKEEKLGPVWNPPDKDAM